MQGYYQESGGKWLFEWCSFVYYKKPVGIITNRLFMVILFVTYFIYSVTTIFLVI
jgi:hypothetical protein